MSQPYFISGLLPSLLAYDYGADLSHVAEEEDIGDLQSRGEISEEDAERLMNLLDDPVDIETMDRDRCHELPGLTFALCDRLIEARDKKCSKKKAFEPADVVNIVQPERFIQLEPFVLWRGPSLMDSLSGRARIRYFDRFADTSWPAGYLRLRGGYDLVPHGIDLKLDAGILTMMGERYGGIGFDTERDVILTDGERPSPQLPKGFVSADGHWWSAVGGSYLIGFGQGLVFDNTGRLNPNGWSRDELIFENPDGIAYRPYQGLFGGAAGINGLELGGTYSLDASTFYSNTSNDIYQYDIEAAFNDVWDEETVEWLSFITIPDAYREQLFGGHAAFNFAPRTRICATAYRGNISWLLPGEGLEFADSSRYPESPVFGAAGLDGALGLDPFEGAALDILAEGAVMFNGAFALLTRGIFEYKDDLEIDASFRSYDTDYDNPHNRGRAAPDEEGGNRARDEMGGRISASYIIPWERHIRLRAFYDWWMHPSTYIADHELGSRVELKFGRWFGGTTWFRWRDNDLAVRGRGEDYAGSGEKFTWAVGLSTDAIPLTSLALQYAHYWEDDSFHDDRFREDHSLSALVAVELPADFTVRGRVRFSDEDRRQADRGERMWWAYLQLEARLWKSLRLAGRYDCRIYTDTREATLEREQNPEHIIRTTVDYLF